MKNFRHRLLFHSQRLLGIATGIIVALALNEFAKGLFDRYYKHGFKSLSAKFFYAAFAILLGVLLSMLLTTEDERERRKERIRKHREPFTHPMQGGLCKSKKRINP